MANLRVAYAASQFANLDWSPTAERPIDRVAAAGHAQHIDIWHARYGGDTVALAKLLRVLGAEFARRYPGANNAVRICEQALHEFMASGCTTCTGSGNVKAADNVNESVPCDACHGSGTQRHSDEQRARRMQISYATARISGSKINWLVSWLTGHDAEINAILNEQLERSVTH